jgi:abortive infection bacteriophage resistance protein
MGGRFFMYIVKPFLAYEAQIEKICSRGCLIEDSDAAKTALSTMSYYRLSAYFLPFKQNDGNYKQGTRFETICRIYEFDRKLRNILFAALARIEIFLRANLAYYHAEQYGPLGYKNVANYRPNGHDHARFEDQIKAEIKKNNKIPFVHHHNQKYGGQFPLWVVVELFTFGMLSRFYADLRSKDQKRIARTLFRATPKLLASWLRCCTDLRNICAHHGRLYYRSFSAVPGGIANIDKKDDRRVFSLLLILKKLYPCKKAWNDEVCNAVCTLADDYKNDIQFRHIGFPLGWKALLRA